MTEKPIISATIPLESGFSHILLNIAAQGYHCIHVDFSGAYKSFDISFALYKENPRKKTEGPWKQPEDVFKEYDAKLEPQLKSLLHDKAEEILEKIDDWWYKDEGAHGNILINTLDGSYDVIFNKRIMTDDTSYHGGKLDD